MKRRADTSAGLLAFRRGRQPGQEIEVLLAHPGGPFWAKKDAGAWTIPKGLAEPGDDLLATAQREFTEETGFTPIGEFLALPPVRQKSGKTVHAWAFEADFDVTRLVSNTFAMEWPPRSGRQKEFPEVDRISWFTLPEAANKILTYQRPFLVALQQVLRTHL